MKFKFTNATQLNVFKKGQKKPFRTKVLTFRFVKCEVQNGELWIEGEELGFQFLPQLTKDHFIRKSSNNLIEDDKPLININTFKTTSPRESELLKGQCVTFFRGEFWSIK
jgi:hypothetical protein